MTWFASPLSCEMTLVPSLVASLAVRLNTVWYYYADYIILNAYKLVHNLHKRCIIEIFISCPLTKIIGSRRKICLTKIHLKTMWLISYLWTKCFYMLNCKENILMFQKNCLKRLYCHFWRDCTVLSNDCDTEFRSFDACSRQLK